MACKNTPQGFSLRVGGRRDLFGQLANSGNDENGRSGGRTMVPTDVSGRSGDCRVIKHHMTPVYVRHSV